MTYEQAKKIYGITVPSDEVFYSKEYTEYFSNINDPTRIIKPEFEQYHDFHEMYLKSYLDTFYTPDDLGLITTSHEAVVLGGQAGAGKSALVCVAKKEFKAQHKFIYLIDDDQYRMLYPKATEILSKYPEYFTQLSAIGTAAITPKLLKYASDRGYNFIFDGTMKNTRIIQTSNGWKDYDINWKIMATSKINSLLSAYERETYLRSINKGRSITPQVHNSTYEGLESTVDYLEHLPNVGRIQVYTRSSDPTSPVLGYDSKGTNNTYSSATIAIRKLRAIDEQRTFEKGIEARIQSLYDSPRPLTEAELESIELLKQEIILIMNQRSQLEEK